MNLNKPVLKTSAEIARLKRPARAVGKVLFELRERVLAGVRINDIAEFCETRLRAYGVQPAQQGYKAFPGRFRSLLVQLPRTGFQITPSYRRETS